MLARRILAVAALSAACSDASDAGVQPTARRPEPSELGVDRVVAAVLDECHRPLMTRMRSVKARVTLPDGRALMVQAELPDRVRVQEGRRELLLRGADVFLLDAGGEPSAAACDEVRALARLVDAAAFGPLHRAGTAQRAVAAADGSVRYELADGSVLRLRDDSLLPASLTIGEHDVHFDDYRHTPPAWVVSRATLAGLGSCDVFFEDGGVRFADSFFDPPGSAKRDVPRIRMTTPGARVEPQSETPEIVNEPAEQWIVLPDPGTWQARHETYRPVHEELVRQQQHITGFAKLFEQDGRTFMAAPFRRRDNGPEFALPDGWQLRAVPGARLLVVYPGSGTVQERTQAGREQLERELRNRQLQARGPIVAQPFVHLGEGAPDADRLATAKVRMSVRID